MRLTFSETVVMTSITGFLASECSSLASAIVIPGNGMSLWRAGCGQRYMCVFKNEVDLPSTMLPLLLYCRTYLTSGTASLSVVSPTLKRETPCADCF